MTGKNRVVCFSVALMTILVFTCGVQQKKEKAEKYYPSVFALFQMNKADSAFVELQQLINLQNHVPDSFEIFNLTVFEAMKRMLF